MKQREIIQKFNALFKNMRGVSAAVMIGSFGRGTPRPNSDIDYQLLVDENFDDQLFFSQIKAIFKSEFKHSIFLEDKNKWTLYLTNDFILTEVFICNSLQELDKYYLGSEILNLGNAIVFDQSNTVYSYLQLITEEKRKKFVQLQKNKVEYLLFHFQNRFEACSSAHARSDGYKFGVLYSHSLNAVVRLIYLYKGEKQHDYMPPNFLTTYSYHLKLGVEKMGTMDLTQANYQKRKLLDLFLEYLPMAIEKFEIDQDVDGISSFLESIYERDFFWNFRDIAKFNPKIASGLVYRSSALCLVKEEGVLSHLLDKYNIWTIADLRADCEIEKNKYSDSLQSKQMIVHAPFDPWNQSIDFRNKYHNGTNIEIAYRFFALECKQSIKKVVETVLNATSAVCIHCHAGKDRTGIVITIFHLLSGLNEDEVFLDYLASEMDTRKEYLEILLSVVQDAGGIVPYLMSCDLAQEQIDQLKNKLLNGN